MARSKYRSLVRLVARDVMCALKESINHKRFKRILPDERSIYLWDRSWSGNPLRPESARGFYVTASFVRRRGRGSEIDGYVHEDVLGNSHIGIRITHDPHNPRQRSEIYAELIGVIRHEIEHISDESTLAAGGPLQDWCLPGLPNYNKIVHTLNLRKKLFCPKEMDPSEWAKSELSAIQESDAGDMYHYMTCYEELGPLVHGFYYEAKTRKIPIDQVISTYLSRMLSRDKITHPEFKDVFEKMITWVKLNLTCAKMTEVPTY